MITESYRFTIGAIECLAILDGQAEYQAASYAANAPAEEVADAVRAHGDDPAHIPSPYSALLLTAGQLRVLIDTGAGDYKPGFGRLGAGLQARGVAPADIDLVVITHAHPDHLGGLADADGRVAFPRAHYLLLRAEWAYWMGDPEQVSPVNRRMLDFARRKLGPVAGQVDLIDGGEIVPGVVAVPAPGHTPGQMAVAIASGPDELLYISDAWLHPIHLAHPDWYTVWDVAPDQAVATRRALLDRAAARRSLVLAFHTDPFPSLGHVVREGAGWGWQAVVGAVSVAD